MQFIASRILAKSRKNWLRVRPVFVPFSPVTATEIERIECAVGTSLPEDLKGWLLAAGYGDIDEQLSFRYDWFHAIEEGDLRGAVIFAQDILGNFYAYSRENGAIYFFERSAPQYAKIAHSFCLFMEKLEQRDFKLVEWMDSLVVEPYARSA